MPDKTPLEEMALALMKATEKEWAWKEALAKVPDLYARGLIGADLLGETTQANNEYMKALVELHFSVKRLFLSMAAPVSNAGESDEPNT